MVKSKIQTGTLLIAKPFWPNKVYEHSVILILDAHEKGHSGLMVNKKSDVKIKEILPSIRANNQVYLGGPFNLKDVSYLHSNRSLEGSVEICKDIFWGGFYEDFMLKNTSEFLKGINFYAGNVQWTAGELDYEVHCGKWWVSGVTAKELFSEGNLYRDKLTALGHMYGFLEDVPDPSLN